MAKETENQSNKVDEAIKKYGPKVKAAATVAATKLNLTHNQHGNTPRRTQAMYYWASSVYYYGTLTILSMRSKIPLTYRLMSMLLTT